MKKLKQTLKKKYAPVPLAHLERLMHNFSPAERVAFWICSALLALGALGLLFNVNELFLTSVPARGGSLTEGVIGSPRFVNPLLALSDADRDLTSLIYSGLLRATPEGNLIPDLAESVEASVDGLSYTFRIRENARFHDGHPVTADDVLYTIQEATDLALKSPKRANWEGVSAEKMGEREVRLTLKQPYSPFLENATMGILPKHVWGTADAEQFPFSLYNIEAVGSGPYRVARIRRNASGLPSVYELIPFREYALGAPYIEHVTIRFYPNEKELIAALTAGEIESVNTIAPKAAKALEEKGYRTLKTPLPRVFAVFFNQNQAPLFVEKDVRRALALATDKEALVNSVLEGYGVPIEGPVPPLLLDGEDAREATSTEARVREAERLLERAGWNVNPETGIREKKKGKEVTRFSFSLSTSDVPELREGAELIAGMWKRLGAEVKLEVFESADLNQTVIRPRRFDALLFGEIIGRDLDLFAFWHSSQRNDPGLNVAMYTNAKVNQLLDDARKTSDEKKRAEKYRSAVSGIEADVPAVFLYSPQFIYIVPNSVKGLRLGRVTVPSERFLSLPDWYIETEKIWDVFAKK